MPGTGSIAVRVAALGRNIFQDVIAPEGNPTVGGVLEVLDGRDVEYNGDNPPMYLNGAPATMETEVRDRDCLILVPEKPTGN